MANIDSIKRAARKEAWYGDSYSRVLKTTRSSTWGHRSNPKGANRDVEAADNVEYSSPLSNVQTEPIPESPHYGEGEHRHGMGRDFSPSDTEMTKADGSNGRSSDPTSDTTGTTIVEKQSTHQSGPQKGGLVNRLFKRGKKDEEGSNEPDDAPKKRPWYKGKVLKHKPYTVRNQLGATIFNSWVNLLLIAAPVGIAVNYAGL